MLAKFRNSGNGETPVDAAEGKLSKAEGSSEHLGWDQSVKRWEMGGREMGGRKTGWSARVRGGNPRGTGDCPEWLNGVL